MLISIQRKKSYAGSLRANFQPTNGFYAGGRIEKKNSLCATKFQILDKMVQKLKANKTTLERKTLDL